MNNRRKIGRLFLSVFIAVILTTSVFVVSPAIVQGVEIVYSEGFETGDGSYTHVGTNDQWAWGSPTSGPGSAHSGSKLWATNLTADVPRYSMSNSYLTSPVISIRALNANEIARVRFFGWIEIDEMFDRGEFQVSSDGTTWETKAEFFYIMQGDWTEYYFDVSDYAGGDIYLRFRLYADTQEAFWIEKGGPAPYANINMAGWYIDDLAIEIAETPTIETTLTLEAWENQGSLASCPWVYTWNGEEFVKDNDVYSTARGQAKEFTDYYTLNKPLVSKDGQYLLELRETEDESSYTDLVQLITIDHAAGVEIAADDNGNVLTYSSPSQPDSATDDEGNNVLSEVATEDNTGFNGHNDDYVVLDFSSLDIANGATFVLRVQGFQEGNDAGAEDATFTRPWVHIQTQDANGDWVTRNEFYPREEWSTSAYDLSGYMATSQRVRLYATSHHGKYHVIDYAGLDTSSQAPTTINVLPATSAVHSINGDVLNSISISDDSYATMTPSESMAFAFDAPAFAGEVRDFVLVSEGYYIPMGTFFIYTWNGTGWAQRDGWSVEVNSDQTRDFDLSSWLPDPDGEYKVRIWQDYWYQNARIDYVGLTQDSVAGTLDTAVDLRNVANRDVVGPTPWNPSLVETRVSASDDQYMLYAQEPAGNYYGPNGFNGIPGDYDDPSSFNGYVQRDRWLEVTWTGLIVNDPPTTNPVTVTDILSTTPTISWTYNDADSDTQVEYEVEVWTGSGGTGTNVWDPAVGTGAGTSVVYAGSALTPGQTYYARVKAFDGTHWGAWSEASWVVPVNQPPVAICRDVTVSTTFDSCTADASINDGSYDPDGDLLTVQQSPEEPYELGDTEVTLTVTDPDGASDSCMATVTVADDIPPVVLCNAPETIVPPDAPIEFTATATDSCDVSLVEITQYDCYKYTKKGKRIDKTESCVVEVANDTITILDSGGVDDHITWTISATDSSGNTTETDCEILVVNPGKNK